MKKETTVATLEEWFKASEEATVSARAEGERARDYVNGTQLTQTEKTALEKRGQPPVVINRVRRKVDWLIGLEIKQRTDPKAFARTPKHQNDAESVTDAIRFVCDDQDWDELRTLAYENQIVEGYGVVEVVHKQKRNGEVDVVINNYPWDRVFYDPFSRKLDFDDARYKGVVLWMDHEDFEFEFPKAKSHVGKMMDDAATADTFDDKPHNIWVDSKRKRVRVILMWYRERTEWQWCKFIKGMKLDSGVSPYVDEEGDTVCPLIMQSGYVDRDNGRYGVVRDMFDPQDEINKRRSKALHQSVARQVLMTKGVADPKKVREQLAKPDGLIEVELAPDDRFEILDNGSEMVGQLNLMQEAKSEIDMMGANSALKGDTGESASGRAVLARQEGGMIEIGSMNDKLHRFTRTVYRHIWQRIRQYWTEERWIRVTDDEKNVKFVGLNRPMTLGDYLSKLDENEAAAMMQEMQLGPNDPLLNEQVGIENEVSKIDVDIIIEEVPDQVTLQGEMFQALSNYAAAGTIPPEVLIEADPILPVKQKEKLLKMLEERAQQPNPAAQIEQETANADIEKTTAEAKKLSAQTAQIVQEMQYPNV